MKLYLSEKQAANLMLFLHEDAAVTPPDSGGPAAPTSGAQSGGSGYPQVSKWESGIERGPANQVNVTKWSDVVGSKLNRGKANPLNEQGFGSSFLNPIVPFSPISNAMDEKYRNDTEAEFLKKSNAYHLPIPPGLLKTDHILVPKSVGQNATEYEIWNISGVEKQEKFFRKWEKSGWDDYVPSAKDLDEILPNGTLEEFTVNGAKYIPYLERVSDNPLTWKFIGYFESKTGAPYKPSLFFNNNDIPYEIKYREKSTWEEFGNDILLVSMFVAGIFFPGEWIAPILMGLNLAAAGNSLIQGDYADSILFVIFAFLPEIKYGLGLREISEAEATELATAFEGKVGEEQIKETFNGLRPQLRDKALKVLRKSPKAVAKEIDKAISKGATKLTKEQSGEMINKLNDLIKRKLVDPRSARNWKQKLSGFMVGAGKLGIELVAVGILDQTLKTIENQLKGKKPELTKDINDLTARYISQRQEMYNANILNGFEPLAKYLLNNILPIYKKTFGEDEGGYKFLELNMRVTNYYIQNQNQDFNVIIDNIYNEQKREK
jgi:hypothetical protein